MAYRDDILADPGLIAFWEHDETTGTTLVDSEGGFNGTLSGTYTLGTTPSPDAVRAITYGGGKAAIPHNAALLPTTSGGSFSHFAWVKTTSTNSFITHKYTQASPFPGYAMASGIGGTAGHFWVWLGTGAWMTAGVSISDNLWHMIGFVNDRTLGTITLYVDGVRRGIFFGTPSTNASTVDLTVAGEYSTGNNRLSGQVDAVHLSSTVYTPAEVLAFYLAGLSALPVGNARLTHETVETLATIGNNARVTHITTENLTTVSPNARLTHETAEVLEQTNPYGRLTQQTAESLVTTNPFARVTQQVVEVLIQATPSVRVTRYFLEVLVRPPPRPRTYVGIPIFPLRN